MPDENSQMTIQNDCVRHSLTYRNTGKNQTWTIAGRESSKI